MRTTALSAWDVETFHNGELSAVGRGRHLSDETTRGVGMRNGGERHAGTRAAFLRQKTLAPPLA
jgi:hypothetical protein